jgi:hypothetical protein
MKGPQAFVDAAGTLDTRMGQAFVGTRAVFRGVDLHHAMHDADWMDLFMFGITGRRFDAPALKLLHAMWVCTCYPDARLWNNRVAALAGNARSTPALGVAAALSVAEATVYGGHPCVRAIDFLLSAKRECDAGASLEAVVERELAQRRIFGYGRPINAVDERLPWLLKVAREQGLDGGPHLQLAHEVEGLLVARDAKLKMNYAALTAALAADLGLSVREFHHFQVPMLMAGAVPCFVEGSEREPGTVFPLSCGHVQYEGEAPRPWRTRTQKR